MPSRTGEYAVGLKEVIAGVILTCAAFLWSDVKVVV